MSELTVDEAEAARSWLERHQFEHVSTVGGDSAAFGDRQDIWERSGTRFRLTRDRGQWWYDISRDGADLWLDSTALQGDGLEVDCSRRARGGPRVVDRSGLRRA